MCPIIELRGAIPIGLEWGIPFWETMVLSLGGNLLIVPFVVLLFNKILVVMRKIKLTAKAADWLEKRAEKNSAKIENLMFVGLMLFVAIPLPGTGAWTASMVAGLMKLKLRKSIIPIALGVLVAAVIVTLVYSAFKIII
jgi:uncharacterized membrane protein